MIIDMYNILFYKKILCKKSLRVFFNLYSNFE